MCVPGVVQALHPDRRVRVHRVPEAGAAVGAGAPGEDLAELVHHGAVVGAGRDVLDPHHLHHLSLLGFGIPLVHPRQFVGLRDASMPVNDRCYRYQVSLTLTLPHLHFAVGAVVSTVRSVAELSELLAAEGPDAALHVQQHRELLAGGHLDDGRPRVVDGREVLQRLHGAGLHLLIDFADGHCTSQQRMNACPLSQTPFSHRS